MEILKKIMGKDVKIKADQVIGITETGSNENGEWIKYEDGTMIQMGICIASANVNHGSATFPTPFKDTNYYVNLTHKYVGADGGSTQIRTLNSVEFNGASGCYVFSVYSDGTIPTFKRTIMFQAIGRWK